MAVHIETGRTHQIRVHLAHIGCPIAGDLTYARRRLKQWADCNPNLRQMLHAARLQFCHPLSGQQMQFVAPLPEDMIRFSGAVGLVVSDVSVISEVIT
jgi:23S rRNA pseudouridine1911/1915/1917 synthase